MAVVPRKLKDKTVYRVAIKWQGRLYWEDAGSDSREARRLDARRKKEVKAGTYVPPHARSGAMNIKGYATRFFANRTNKNSAGEARQVELHALSIAWFADLEMEDARPHHFLQLVQELRAKKKIVNGVEKRAHSEKSIANIFGTIRTMFGDAHLRTIVSANWCVLPKKALARKSKSRKPYHGSEVLALLSEKVDVTRRAFIWIAFFTGMREGEIAGRRWHDWIRDARPLTALLCMNQYDGKELKGENAERNECFPRVIPVHKDLEAVLSWWWREGWELVHCRKPTLDDFIVPNRRSKKVLSKSSGYKLWRKACDEAGVTNHSLHSTRHTFTTFARRGSPRKDVIEAITHNSGGESAGQMVDYYNHWLWTPLCEAVASLSFRADADERHPLASARGPVQVGPVEASPAPKNDVSDPDDFKQAAGGEFAKRFARPVQVLGTTVEAPGIEPGSARHRDNLRSRA